MLLGVTGSIGDGSGTRLDIDTILVRRRTGSIGITHVAQPLDERPPPMAVNTPRATSPDDTIVRSRIQVRFIECRAAGRAQLLQFGDIYLDDFAAHRNYISQRATPSRLAT